MRESPMEAEIVKAPSREAEVPPLVDRFRTVTYGTGKRVRESNTVPEITCWPCCDLAVNEHKTKDNVQVAAVNAWQCKSISG